MTLGHTEQFVKMVNELIKKKEEGKLCHALAQ